MPRPTHYKRGTPKLMNCFACSEAFFPQRLDARYCGPACRQRMSRAMRSIATLKKTLVSTNAPKAKAALEGEELK